MRAGDEWPFEGIIYGYCPDVDGTTPLKERGGSSIRVDASRLFDDPRFTFMGTLEALSADAGPLVGPRRSRSGNVNVEY